MKKRCFIVKLALIGICMCSLTSTVSATNILNNEIVSSEVSKASDVDILSSAALDKLASQTGKSLNSLIKEKVPDIDNIVNKYVRKNKWNNFKDKFKILKPNKEAKNPGIIQLKNNITDKIGYLLNNVSNICDNLSVINEFVSNSLQPFSDSRSKDVRGVKELKQSYKNIYKILENSIGGKLESFSKNKLVKKLFIKAKDYDNIFKFKQNSKEDSTAEEISVVFSKVVEEINKFVNFDKIINNLVKQVYDNNVEKKKNVKLYKLERRPVTTVYNMENRPVTTAYTDEKKENLEYISIKKSVEDMRNKMTSFMFSLEGIIIEACENIYKEVVKEFELKDNDVEDLDNYINCLKEVIHKVLEKEAIFNSDGKINEENKFNACFNSLDRYIYLNKGDINKAYEELTNVVLKRFEKFIENIFAYNRNLFIKMNNAKFVSLKSSKAVTLFNQKLKKALIEIFKNNKIFS